MWFQLDIAASIGRRERIPTACALIRRHVEFGWDEAFGGGILLARDARNGAQVAWPCSDLKLWWPHTEALYALLDVYRHNPQSWCLEWYDRILAHCLRHYCDWPNGEWRQNLNRDHTPFVGTVAYPVKDPFHLPRSLMLQIEALEDPDPHRQPLENP